MVLTRDGVDDIIIFVFDFQEKKKKRHANTQILSSMTCNKNR